MILWLLLMSLALVKGNKKTVKCQEGQWRKGKECKAGNYSFFLVTSGYFGAMMINS